MARDPCDEKLQWPKRGGEEKRGGKRSEVGGEVLSSLYLAVLIIRDRDHSTVYIIILPFLLVLKPKGSLAIQ